MEKSILDLTKQIRNQKKWMPTTEVKDVVGNFVVKLCRLKKYMIFKNKQLPLNENDNNFGGNLNDIN